MSPLTWSTISLWDSVHKSHGWKYNSPLMSLMGHSYFPPGQLDPQFCHWLPSPNALLHHVTNSKGLLPVHSIIQSTFSSFMDYWRHTQLTQFIKSLPKPLRSVANFTPVEQILVNSQPAQKTISQFYKAMLELDTALIPNFIRAWELDLQQNLTDIQHSTILYLTHISSISSKFAEVNYKMITRWHLTPAHLHDILPNMPALCWRGCGELATHAHIWWQCPLIRPYWSSILH